MSPRARERFTNDWNHVDHVEVAAHVFDNHAGLQARPCLDPGVILPQQAPLKLL